MAQWQTIAFTSLELKGLWIRATGGNTSADRELDQAAENAVDKVWRAEKGMGKKPTPPHNPVRGSPLSCGKTSLQTSA